MRAYTVLVYDDHGRQVSRGEVYATDKREALEAAGRLADYRGFVGRMGVEVEEVNEAGARRQEGRSGQRPDAQ